LGSAAFDRTTLNGRRRIANSVRVLIAIQPA
jgi:hypothetical protein